MKIITDTNILRKQNLMVNVMDYKNLHKQIPIMVKLMIKNNGCGIAAPQVGINKRFFVAIINNKEIKIFINPKIIEYSKETNLDTEGCLSIPNMEGVIERYNWIKIKYFNGKKIVTELYTGLNARIIQHENDHLDGILYTDKMVKEKAI